LAPDHSDSSKQPLNFLANYTYTRNYVPPSEERKHSSTPPDNTTVVYFSSSHILNMWQTWRTAKKTSDFSAKVSDLRLAGSRMDFSMCLLLS